MRTFKTTTFDGTGTAFLVKLENAMPGQRTISPGGHILVGGVRIPRMEEIVLVFADGKMDAYDDPDKGYYEPYEVGFEDNTSAKWRVYDRTGHPRIAEPLAWGRSVTDVTNFQDQLKVAGELALFICNAVKTELFDKE